MAFTYTSKFVQLTSYLLMEYRYADQPNPETHFTNTGSSTVGFDKLVNGFRQNSIQIFNPDVDFSITGNTADGSVVRYTDTSFVTLDQNLIVPFNDFADELTNTTNLPITFPSNLSVVYDSVRYHIRAGYNLSNIDGLIASIEFPDQNGNYVTMSQIQIKKGTAQDYNFSPTPISIGSAIYDKYIEVKIPNLKDMNDKYLVASDFFKPSTLAGLISQSGNGFIYGAPLRIYLWQIDKTTTVNGYDKYDVVNLATLSLEQEDPFSNIGATIKESDQGEFFEYYATDNEGFVEDFILFQNSIGNSYFISHQIQVVEQIGASFIETSRFETIQRTAFDVPNYYRPIVRNAGVAASFSLRYTMSLINNKDQSRVIRIGTYTSNDPSAWGTEIAPIQLSNFPQVQKIYNRIYGQNEISNGNLSSRISVKEVVTYVNNIVQQNYISTVFNNLTVQDASSSTTGEQNVTALGKGKLTIEISPFDNLFKFKVIKRGPDGSPTELDLTSFGVLRMVFIEDKGEKLNIVSLSDNTLANPARGEVIFRVDGSVSSKILLLKDKRFFITSGEPEPDISKQLDPDSSVRANLRSSIRPRNLSIVGSTPVRGIRSRGISRANALNAAKTPISSDNFRSNVLYWSYWKTAGEEDVNVSTGATGGTKEEIVGRPVIQRPLRSPSKSPNLTSVNRVTPSSVTQRTQNTNPPPPPTALSDLTGSQLDSSISNGIRSIFEDPSSLPFGGGRNPLPSVGSSDFNLSDVSKFGTRLVDLYSKYPQIDETKFLRIYDSVTKEFRSYSREFINRVKSYLLEQI